MMHVQMVRAGHMTDRIHPATSDTARWQAVLRRDGSFDGRFVYAVTSTGVFCRPSCPSRRPRPDRVRFFETPAAAERAGYRACRRCGPRGNAPAIRLPEAIDRASRYLTEHSDESVPLTALSRIANLSASHLQREFKRALGLSPREFQAACRADRFREKLRNGHDVSSALYEAGYGSPSRIYEASPTGRGMQPATYRRGGAGVDIGFVTVRCALGWLLVGATEKGVCAVKLGDTREVLEADLRREFSSARISPRRHVQSAWVEALVHRLEGDGRELTLPLDVRGTAFQWRVWRALQQIPAGETRSYSEVALELGAPAAVRAVANACARNPVCLVVPCHRVTAKNGATGGYRWGVARKERLLAQEAQARGRKRRRAAKSK
jgi:AraC family transcriptional regulator of adaptative response/methylated-DNA-[protein]-cysteine methyltransferase